MSDTCVLRWPSVPGRSMRLACTVTGPGSTPAQVWLFYSGFQVHMFWDYFSSSHTEGLSVSSIICDP